MAVEKSDIVEAIVIGAGSSRAISMSNTRNKTANKKKRKEKGLRAEFLGSNPHSNGLIFSRCELE